MNFSIVGTGNAAWHFSEMLQAQGHHLLQVYSRRGSAAPFGTASIISQPEELSSTNDLVVLAVKDDAIADLSAQINADLFVIHTSGTTDMNVLRQSARGVVWPAQTLIKEVVTDYSEIPFLVEASSEQRTRELVNLFLPISSKTLEATSDQRAHAHLAAVFGNNFTIQLLDAAAQILVQNNLPRDLVIASVKEAVRKMETKPVYEVQTGPARRADMKTIERHLRMLQSDPALQHLYTQFTNRILKSFHDREL